MPDFPRILSAASPLTLASVARGSLPLVMADLARSATGRAVYIAADDSAMRSATEAAHFFAPELEVLEFPAWDCLPYDRASPGPGIGSRRLSALHRLQASAKQPQLLVTTVNAVLQRALTPFRIRGSVRELKPGIEIAHGSLTSLLQRQGYSRTDTVVDVGEFAVRGSIFDIYPPGLGQGLRLDFFGDELESLRLFDPATQRTTGTLEEFLLLPASEALLDEETIKRFRGSYREMFGAPATQDPLYEAVSDSRRLAGMEHWLPLFEDKLSTLFEHLSEGDQVVIDNGAIAAADERMSDIEDYYRARKEASGQAAGNYRPLPAETLYLGKDEFERALAAWPVHQTTIFAAPESGKVVDFGFSSARDFAPERARGDNVYEAAGKYLRKLGKKGKRPLIAAYSEGSRSRITSVLGEAGLEMRLAESWQDALGKSAKSTPAIMVLPLETGFANDELEVLTEADILGDRL
ncbi:transcription-repair coupling factor, partial [Sphingomonadaceae bacterium]|nr:transcription-repair coupling factor [Sphingomonadaceae bacterium]